MSGSTGPTARSPSGSSGRACTQTLRSGCSSALSASRARCRSSLASPCAASATSRIQYPFEFVGVDVVGPFPTSARGNKYIVVFTDYLTRWVEAFACVDHTAKTIARLLLEEVVPRHGAPRVLLSDNGAEFRSALVREVTKLFGTQQRYASPYHPQCNGLTERANGSIVALLSLLCDVSQDNWDACLGMALFSHRSAINVTMGVSPFRLLYGREAVLPFEAMVRRPARPELPARWRDVADYVEALQEDTRETHAMVRDFLQSQQLIREVEAAAPRHEARRYDVGDRVWVYRFLRRPGLSPKLTAQRWFGPYIIERRVANADTYLVRAPEGGAAAGEPKMANPFVHAIRLRPYRVRPADMPASSSSEAEDGGGDEGGRRAPPPPQVITANAGPNAGRIFTKGAWLHLRESFWRGLFPGDAGQRDADTAPTRTLASLPDDFGAGLRRRAHPLPVSPA